MSSEDVLKSGYEAYSYTVGGVAHTGKPMPKWQDLPPLTRSAWAAFLRRCLEKIGNETCG